MSAWNMTSVAPVLVSGFEASPSHTRTFPTWRSDGPGRKACVKAALFAPRGGRSALTRAAHRP